MCLGLALMGTGLRAQTPEPDTSDVATAAQAEKVAEDSKTGSETAAVSKGVKVAFPGAASQQAIVTQKSQETL